MENRLQIAKGEVQIFLNNELVVDKNNIIVDVASNLLAQLTRGIIGDLVRPQVDGARTLAVGTGATGWNLQSPPPATATQTLLENEIERNEFDRVDYIDEYGAVTATRTNVLELETTYGTSEANGALVEMGLFGGASSLNANGGTMINYLTFPVINKTNNSTLTILWRLTF